MKGTAIFIFLIGLVHFKAFSQNSTDSLAQLLNRPDDTVKVNLLNRLSAIHVAAGHYDKSESFAIEAQHLAEKINYPLGIHWSLRRLYRNANAKAQFIQCLSLINRAIEIAEELGRTDLLVDSKLDLASTLSNMDFNARALRVTLEACSIATKLNNRRTTGIALMHLAGAYDDAGNFRMSINYDLQAVELWKDLKDVGSEAICYSNAGLGYTRMNNYDSAIYYHKKAIDTYEKAGEVENMAYLLAMCGKSYMEGADYEHALLYFGKAIRWHKEKGPAITTYAYCLLNISEIVLTQSRKEEKNFQVNYVKIIDDLEEAIRLFKSYDNFRFLFRAYTALQEIYERTGNYKKAIDYARQVLITKDSINGREQTHKLNELMVQHQVKESAQKISCLKQETNTYNLIVSLLIGLVSVSIFSGFLLVSRERLRFKNEKRQLELTVLRSQMNPHFIFNCLNTIQDRVLASQPAEATKYIGDFGLLLRKILNNSDRPFIKLKEEITMIELYLKMEALRFKDQFTWEIKIDPKVDPDSVEFPPMLVQPIVENAIHHGLLEKEGERNLLVHFFEMQNRLICEVEDNGVGVLNHRGASVKDPHRASKGTTLISNRIALLNEAYSLKGLLQMTDLSEITCESGTKVELSFDLGGLVI